jgi:DNA-binding NtrC family response regulator
MKKIVKFMSNFPMISELYHTFCHYNGILSINKNGIIEEALFSNHYFLESSYKKIIGQNISKFYYMVDTGAIEYFATQLQPDAPPSQLKTLFPEKAFSSRNIFEHFDRINDFYTLYPFSRLSFVVVKDLGYFGIIRFARFLTQRSPNLRLDPMFFLNSEGRLTGLNSLFASYFGKQGSAIKELLNQPILSLCSKNPVQCLTMSYQESEETLKTEWKTIAPFSEEDHDTEAAEKWIPYLEGTCSMKASSLIWEPYSRNDQGLLCIRMPIDTKLHDFILETEVTVDTGEILSCIISGDSDPDAGFPDYDGYLLGPAEHDNVIQIKKQGSFLSCKPIPVTPQPGQRYALAFIKRGDRIAIYFNGSPILMYRDPLMTHKKDSYQYLYCRKHAKIAIHSLRLSVAPRTEKEDGGLEISLLCNPPTTFTFRQYLDMYRPPDNQIVYCFALSRELLPQKYSSVNALPHEPVFQRQTTPWSDERFIGNNPSIVRIREQALAVATSKLTVLIEGETGTGKEVLANYIHINSPFRNGPFIKVDCSLLPQSLIESELFGHEKGAFTGAMSSRTGKFESAQEGTLFLDEISNLDPLVQAKLLHFLQDLTLERVGGNRRIQVNTRIITATNKSLQSMVQAGTFRADLYYRLNALRLSLPPLRERLSDIPLLVRNFLNEFSQEQGRAHEELTAAAYQKLMAHNWPGNIRELQSIIRKAALFCTENTISAEYLDLPEPSKPLSRKTIEPIPIRGDSRLMTRDYIQELLISHNWVVKRAADTAGVSLSTLFRKIKKFGLERKE